MAEQNKPKQQQGTDQEADYNPTARNFDQTDVSGDAESISGDRSETSATREDKARKDQRSESQQGSQE